MSDNKRYFWFKLSDDFFKDRRIKRLRRLAGGDTYTIIYQKMLLLTLKTGGIYEIDDYEDLAESLSLDIDEDVDNIKVTLEFLKSSGLIIENPDKSILLTEVKNLTGSETASTIRSRKSRKKKLDTDAENTKVLQCNTNATNCNTEIEIEKELDIEKETELELDVEREKENNALSQSSTSSTPTSNNTLTSAEYTSLVTVYGKDLVDQKVANAKNYKNCLNFKTIRKWCNEEVEKEVEKDMKANGFY